MDPFSERRHRLNPSEVKPTIEAVRYYLAELLNEKSPERVDAAADKWRFWGPGGASS